MNLLYKLKHFYFNKYLVTPFSNNTYFLSYNYRYKTLWFRNYKVASRTIHKHFTTHSKPGENIYSSEVGYCPALFKNYFKFAFVRNPMDRFLSAYKNKVISENYFGFNPEKHDEMMNPSRFLEWLYNKNPTKMDEHFRPQHTLIDIDNLDFLGRVESFQQDFAKLCRKVGLPVKSFPRHNKSMDIAVNFSKKNKVLIKDIYELDYRIFYPHEI